MIYVKSNEGWTNKRALVNAWGDHVNAVYEDQSVDNIYPEENQI